VSGADKVPQSWSPDGRFLMFTNQDPQMRSDIYIRDMTGSGRQTPLVRTEFQDDGASFSPDGKSFIYTSTESGRSEAYLQPFPPNGNRWQLSTGGASSAVWNPAGGEVFSVDDGGKLNSIAVTFRNGDADVAPPKVLFIMPPGHTDFNVTADGQRFLVNAFVEDDRPPIAQVVVKWSPPR